MTRPLFGSLAPQEAVLETPEAYAVFEREMRVTGERPAQLTLEQRKIEAAPFIRGDRGVGDDEGEGGKIDNVLDFLVSTSNEWRLQATNVSSTISVRVGVLGHR